MKLSKSNESNDACPSDYLIKLINWICWSLSGTLRWVYYISIYAYSNAVFINLDQSFEGRLAL